MFSRLIKSLCILFFTLTLSVTFAHASGKMEVKPGEKVTLKVEDQGLGSLYKWVVKKDKDLVSAQTGTVFTYQFDQPGEYQVNLTTTNSQETIRTTSVVVKVGEKFTRTPPPGEVASAASAFTLTTLPPLDKNRVHVIGDGKVLFHIEGGPDILEYRVDQNIYADSDNNGTANDDIDNASSESYLKGGYFEAHYKAAEAAKAVAEITAVARDGTKTKKQVEIVFDNPPDKTAQPLASFQSLPAASPEDQVVHLYGEEAKVGFYAETSVGNVVEYRIDKNIFEDSDKDGNPANDIDNLNDPSFKTGDVWTTTYKKTEGQLIAQLIVVTADGKGSRLQRALQFSDKAPVSFADYQGQIRLTADKTFVRKGDPVTFRVQGLALSPDQYTFDWDLNGDGKAEKTVEGDPSLVQIFDQPGPQTIAVLVTDKEGHTGQFTLQIPVEDSVKTAADFDFAIDGNAVKFTNKSTAAESLASKTLQFHWDFADTDEQGYTEQKDQTGVSDPAYAYYKAGTFHVTLTVTDADSVTASKTADVVIAKDLEHGATPAVANAPAEKASASPSGGIGSLVVKILKIMLYILLVVLGLAALLLSGLLIVLKLQHPGLTLDELIEEFKRKLLGTLGVDEEMIESHGPAAAPIPHADLHSEEAIPVPPPAPAPAPILTPAPLPDPQAGKPEVVEGEIVTPPNHPPATGELAKPEGPVPDWLKGL